jgi:uncharacterized protein YjdB
VNMGNLRLVMASAVLVCISVLVSACGDEAAQGALLQPGGGAAQIRVSPRTLDLVVDESFALSVSATAANGASVPPGDVQWSSSIASVANVAADGTVTANSPGSTAVRAKKGVLKDSVVVRVRARKGPRITASPASLTLHSIGARQQLAAEVVDDQNQPVATDLGWSVVHSAVAEVDDTGSVTARSAGITMVVVSALCCNVADTVLLNVSPVVAEVVVTPSAATIRVTEELRLQAVANDPGGTPVDGRQVAWSSTAPEIASISAAGVLTALGPGVVRISATVDGVSGHADIAVMKTAVVKVVPVPAALLLQEHGTHQMGAVPQDSAGNPLNDRACAWSSSDSNIVSVSKAGLATGVAAGAASLTVTCEGVSEAVPVTVERAQIATLTISPAAPEVQAGATIQLLATLKDAAGNTLTDRSVAWSSSNVGVANVSATGVVSGVTSGTATVTATSEGKSAQVAVTVTAPSPAAVASVAIAPAAPSLTVGGTVQLTATLRDAAGNILSGRTVTWSTSNAAVATVSPTGVLTGVGAGGATVTATSEGTSAQVQVTVTGAAGVYTVPADIKADCSVDVTGALLKWIASVPNNSTLQFGTNACYRIDSGLVIDDRIGLTFEGNGSTFQVFTQGHGQRANWIFRGGSNLTLRNMIARGANPNAGLAENAYVRALEWQHGYRLRGVQGAVLDNVQAYDVYGDYVNLSHDNRVTFPGPPNRNIVVKNGRFERNGRYGFTITNAEDVVFDNNYLGETRWSHINIELNGKEELGRNVLIEGNQFGRANHHMIVSSGAGVTGRVGNFVIRGNTMVADPLTCLAPIVFSAPEGWTNPDGSPVYWDGFVIENNNLRLQTGGWGIHLLRIRDVVIRNNQMASHTHSGCSQDHVINLVDSHRVQITGNTFTTAYLAHGRFWIHTYRADALSSAISEVANVLQ